MKKLLMTLSLAFAAAIAIPSVANAQSTTTATRQTKECCKEKKSCDKAADGKACDKEAGKACSKDGKSCCQGKMNREGKIKLMEKKKGQRTAGDRREIAGKKRGGENPLMKGITLSEAQQQKVKALKEKNKAAEKKSKADMKEQNRNEMRKLRAEFDKEMEKILDKDQLKQYKANKAEMQAQRAAKKNK